MSTEDLAVVRTLYEALARGDVFTFMNGLDDDIEWTVAPGFPYADGNPYRGRPAVMALFGRILGEWKRFRIDADEILDGGDKIVVLGHYSGIYRPTKRSVRAAFAHIGELGGGKVVRYRQIADTVQFARAMEPLASAPPDEPPPTGTP